MSLKEMTHVNYVIFLKVNNIYVIWVFKIKLKENSEVDIYKEQLVIKG